jgi:ubiquinol-cytochrome c reductase cytochrome c subunit
VTILALAASALLAGALPYQQYCSTCHGADLRGTVNGPSLRGVGPAAVDFYLTTGRMPAAEPWVEVGHRGPQLPPDVIAQIVAYVSTVAPGGTPIPHLDTSTPPDLAVGHTLYEQNCEHCHGVTGGGASIGYAEFAPGLHHAPIEQVAEAIRIGPDQMPPFSHTQLDDKQLTDVANYVFSLDRDAATLTIPLRSSGPVPEGLIGWLAVALLATLAFVFSRGAR